MHIAIITAGGAGMFCGSCMHDNTWARALLGAGVEASLVPTYTPIRVDEPDHSEQQVFFGGLNVYLRSQHRWWGKLPGWLTRTLDSPRLIRWATRFSVSNAAAQLGQLTLDMLAGEAGPHAQAGADLARHITSDLRPDAVIFSNALLVGAVRNLRRGFCGPILCTLQGDDVFLDGLPPPFRKQAIAAISERARDFDGFLTHSQFYREYMADYLRLDAAKFQLLPLSIDLAGHNGRPGEQRDRPFTVGYFARIAPEKGLHHLTAAFERLHAAHPEVRLRVGGYLGAEHRDYFRRATETVQHLGPAFEYIGSPDTHEAKAAFFRSVDVLSVPTDFQEPKGLYVLEGLANGVPVIQPAHGAFPELIAATGGGLLVPPRNPEALAHALDRLRADPDERIRLGTAGQRAIRERFTMPALAAATVHAVESLGRLPRAAKG